MQQDSASPTASTQSSAPPLHVLRSSQLDAARLDTELTSLLGEQLGRVFASFNPGRVLEWDAEINAVLNLLVFGASVWQSPTAATPGSVLLNLKYRSEDPPGSALIPPLLQQWLPRYLKRSDQSVQKPAISHPSTGSSASRSGLFPSSSSGIRSNSSSSSNSRGGGHAHHQHFTSSSTLHGAGSNSSSSSSSSNSIGGGPAHHQHSTTSSILHGASTPGRGAASPDQVLKQGASLPFMHTAVPRLPLESRQTHMGGRAGVDGPPLSITQRLVLVAGIVVLPYLWSRLGQRLASAAAQGSSTIFRGQTGWRQRMAANPSFTHRTQHANPHSHPAPYSTRAHAPPDSTTNSTASSGALSESCSPNHNRAGVLGVILSSLGLGHLVPMVSAWLRGWTEALREKWQRAISELQWVQGQSGAWLGWRVMRAAETSFRGAALLNFLAFLAGGKYRSLLERLAGARLVYEQPHMTRVISFEYLNRQLVWREISELLLLLLPLLDAAKFRRNLGRLMPRLPSPAAAMQHLYTRRSVQESPASEQDQHQRQQQQQQQEDVDQGLQGQRPSGPCPVCGTKEILQAVVAQPCGHVFCYYCLSASCTADRWFECPVDSLRVASMKRWRTEAG